MYHGNIKIYAGTLMDFIYVQRSQLLPLAETPSFHFTIGPAEHLLRIKILIKSTGKQNLIKCILKLTVKKYATIN